MTFEEYKKQTRTAAQADYDTQAAINKAATDKYISETNAAYDAASKVVQDNINSQVDAVPGQYKAKYDTNAINEVITRRKLAERMANLGMSDSGYSRTQDTAILLNKNNADAALGRQQQAEVSALKQQLNEYMASVEEQKAQMAAQAQYELSEKNQNLYNSLMTAADSQAAELYNTDVQAAATRSAASRSSGGSSGGLYIFRGEDPDNNNNMLFTDPNGKLVSAEKGRNPYTGNIHEDVKYGTFSNGYQPDNIDGYKLVDTGVDDNLFGKNQSIYLLPGTTQCYMWNGRIGDYVQVSTEDVDSKRAAMGLGTIS